MSKLIKIECPNCGYEYLPSELFIPRSFFNKPIFINRDSNGKIINEIDGEMNLDETYICDNCSQTFNISASVIFNTTLCEIDNFDEDFTVKL